MTRAFRIGAAVLILFVFVGSGLYLWGESGPRSGEAPIRKTTYGTEYGSAEKDTFTVMTYNLGASLEDTADGSQTTSGGALLENGDQVTALLSEAKPDIIGLQNVGLHTTGSDAPPQLERLATRLSIPEAIQSPDRTRRFLPWRSEGLGQAVLSRFPIRRYLGKSVEQPFWRAPLDTDSFVQIAALDVGGWPLIVMNVQLSNADPQVRTKQVLTIMELYGRLSTQSFPILVMGTFNSLMPAAAPSPSTGTGAMGLLLERTNLQPALSSETAQLSGKPVATFPADGPTRKIDYILHNPDYVVPSSADVLCGEGPHRPSSHCAVTLSFLLPRPKEKLPEKRIPDDRLPSLDRLLGDPDTE